MKNKDNRKVNIRLSYFQLRVLLVALLLSAIYVTSIVSDFFYDYEKLEVELVLANDYIEINEEQRKQIDKLIGSLLEMEEKIDQLEDTVKEAENYKTLLNFK